jgi:hypothetical protein
MVRRSRGGVSAKGAPILHATLLLIGEIIGAAKLSKEYEFFATAFMSSSTPASRGASRRVASDAPH